MTKTDTQFLLADRYYHKNHRTEKPQSSSQNFNNHFKLFLKCYRLHVFMTIFLMKDASSNNTRYAGKHSQAGCICPFVIYQYYSGCYNEMKSLCTAYRSTTLPVNGKTLFFSPKFMFQSFTIHVTHICTGVIIDTFS